MYRGNTNNWWSECYRIVINRYTHTHTRAHTHMHTHTHTHTRMLAPKDPMLSLSQDHRHTHIHMHACTHAHTHTHMRAHTQCTNRRCNATCHYHMVLHGKMHTWHMVLDNPDTRDFTVQTVDPWLLPINGSRAGVYTKEVCQLTF